MDNTDVEERLRAIEANQQETNEIFAHILAVQAENEAKIRTLSEMIDVQGRHTGVVVDALIAHQSDPDAHRAE